MNDRSGEVIGQASGMPSILDKELEGRSADAFGHQDYADALRDLIEAPTNKPPFSIGLLGPWGTGKSSIKALYRCDLQADKGGPAGSRRSDRIHIITFNAWRFGGEQDLKRSLLREAFQQLGGDEAELRQAMFAQVNSVTHQRRSFQDWFGEAFGQLLGAALILVAISVAAFLIALVYVCLTGLTEQYSLAAVFGAAIILAGWFGKTIVDLRVRSPAWYLPQTSVSFPATSAEEYERLLTDQIDLFRRNVGRKCERLVVFVDDLDRLSAPEMVAGLDAIRTFLELPFNTTENGFGVVFVISCDEDKIAEAIKRRSGLGSPDLPGAIFSRGDARRYLDRLFQFRLEIPQFPKLDMRKFALRKLEGIESVSGDLGKRGVALDDVIDRLIHVDVQSPRNAIQLLNAFIQSWWIGRQRERNGVGSDAPGALHEGAVTNHPLSLAALCVLRVDFPDFYDAVQNRAEIIQEFRNVVFDGKLSSGLAPQAREILRDFLVADSNGDPTAEVKRDHRKLRRYLSSLGDLRWPVILQPLLRMAEDPITRRYGDSAAAVFESLISGDVAGVLEAFGRHLDDKPLAPEDVLLLEGFGETLPQETEVRRTNAARVLAALVDRIPHDRRRRILSPLIRQMVNLKAVRMNIQPRRARQIIEGAPANDRRDVAEEYIGDLLNLEPLDWRLATGGEPNLGEMIGAVRDTVELALKVKEADGLSAAADLMLKEWLLKREVRLGSESQTLPFSDLESWVGEHSGILPGDLATDYSDQAIGEFERAETAPLFTASVLPRLSSIFADTAKLGEEEREVLWDQLTRLVAVRPQAAAEAAWRDAARFSKLAGPEERRKFLVAFSGRLCDEIEYGDCPLDGAQGAVNFNDLAAEWRVDIDPKTATALEKLILLWSEDASREQFARRAMDVLEDQAQETWNRIVAGLSQMELSERPLGVSGYLGSKFGAIDEAGKNQVVAQMNALIDTNGADEKSVYGYHTLVKSMPNAGWSEAPLRDHLVRLLDRINAMHSDPVYLSRLLPIAADVFRFAPDGKVGQVLIPLLANAAATPNAYVVVHRCMKLAWPELSQKIGDYRPDDIVMRACQFIQDNPGNPDIGYVYESVCGLAEQQLSGAASSQRIADITPIVWRMAPRQVSALANFVATILKPTSVAEVLTETQSSNLDRGDLSTLLAAASQAFNGDKRHAAARLVLDSAPVPLFERPDGAFECWILAVAKDDSGFVIDLFADESLNDEQKTRVLILIGDSTLATDSPTSIEAALKDSARPKTRSALIGRLAQVKHACGSESAKSKLARHLIASLPSLSGEDLHTVTRQIGDLGGRSALERDDGILSMLDSDQIDVVAKVFPASRRLRDAAKNSSRS